MSYIINPFAGPGAGKSTFSGMLFGRLKLLHYKVEYVQEFAKTLVYQHNAQALEHQPYVTCSQMYYQNILQNHVDIIITDSPIILGLIYDKERNVKIKSSFKKFILESFRAQDNINLFLQRNADYKENGRIQTLEEAVEIDHKIRDFLTHNNIPYTNVKQTKGGFEYALSLVESIVSEKINKKS